MKRKHPLARSNRLSVAVRWSRRVLAVAMVVVIALVVRRFSFRTLDDAQHVALAGKVRQNALLISKEIGEDTAIGKGSLVEAEVHLTGSLVELLGRTEGLILSEIRGVPGMHVSWLDVGDGFIELQLDGERTFAKLRAGWQEEVPDDRRIVEGRIPDRHYILINPAVDADAVDSRRVGMLRRSQLVRKVAWL